MVELFWDSPFSSRMHTLKLKLKPICMQFWSIPYKRGSELPGTKVIP